jgi:hypothetical protein
MKPASKRDARTPKKDRVDGIGMYASSASEMFSPRLPIVRYEFSNKEKQEMMSLVRKNRVYDYASDRIAFPLYGVLISFSRKRIGRETKVFHALLLFPVFLTFSQEWLIDEKIVLL